MNTGKVIEALLKRMEDGAAALPAGDLSELAYVVHTLTCVEQLDIGNGVATPDECRAHRGLTALRISPTWKQA